MCRAYNSYGIESIAYLQVHPGLAKIARVAERAETDSRVASGCQAFSTVGTRHLAAPVGRALLWNDNKSGDLLKVPAAREIERITREPGVGSRPTRLYATRVELTRLRTR